MEIKKDDFLISDDPALINRKKVYALLAPTYWAKGRSKEQIFVSMENSLCFGLYKQNEQIGFARVITDVAVASWLMDLIIEEEYRGHGWGKEMVEFILDHPQVKSTKMRLCTADAHDFYKKYGFEMEASMVLNRSC